LVLYTEFDVGNRPRLAVLEPSGAASRTVDLAGAQLPDRNNHDLAVGPDGEVVVSFLFRDGSDEYLRTQLVDPESGEQITVEDMLPLVGHTAPNVQALEMAPTGGGVVVVAQLVDEATDAPSVFVRAYSWAGAPFSEGLTFPGGQRASVASRPGADGALLGYVSEDGEAVLGLLDGEGEVVQEPALISETDGQVTAVAVARGLESALVLLETGSGSGPLYAVPVDDDLVPLEAVPLADRGTVGLHAVASSGYGYLIAILDQGPAIRLISATGGYAGAAEVLPMEGTFTLPALTWNGSAYAAVYTSSPGGPGADSEVFHAVYGCP